MPRRRDADYMEDVSKLMRHMTLSESTQIRAKHAHINLRIFGPQERRRRRITPYTCSCCSPSRGLHRIMGMGCRLTERRGIRGAPRSQKSRDQICFFWSFHFCNTFWASWRNLMLTPTHGIISLPPLSPSQSPGIICNSGAALLTNPPEARLIQFPAGTKQYI